MNISKDNNVKNSLSPVSNILHKDIVPYKTSNTRIEELKKECIDKMTNDITNKLASDSDLVSVVINNKNDDNGIIKRYNKADFKKILLGAIDYNLNGENYRKSSLGLNFDYILTEKGRNIHQYQKSKMKEDVLMIKHAMEDIDYLQKNKLDDLAEVFLIYIKNGTPEENFNKLSMINDTRRIFHLYEHLKASGMAALHPIEKSFEKNKSLKKIFIHSLKERFKNDKILTEILNFEEGKKLKDDFIVIISNCPNTEFSYGKDYTLTIKNIDEKYIHIYFKKN